MTFECEDFRALVQGKKKKKERMLMPGCTFVSVPAVVVGVVKEGR